MKVNLSKKAAKSLEKQSFHVEFGLEYAVWHKLQSIGFWKNNK